MLHIFTLHIFRSGSHRPCHGCCPRRPSLGRLWGAGLPCPFTPFPLPPGSSVPFGWLTVSPLRRASPHKFSVSHKYEHLRSPSCPFPNGSRWQRQAPHSLGPSASSEVLSPHSQRHGDGVDLPGVLCRDTSTGLWTSRELSIKGERAKE